MKALSTFMPLAATLVATGCSSENDARLAAAKAFRDGADKCLLAVRDDKETYERAGACAALEVLAKSYTDLGGFTESESESSKLIAEEGLSSAWKARAISASGNPAISLW